MDLLIKHGTWIIVPIGLALSFIFLVVAPKVYPFLAAQSLDEQDGREHVTPVRVEKVVEARRRAPVGRRVHADSRL